MTNQTVYEQLQQPKQLENNPPTYDKKSAGIWTNHTWKTELIALQ